MMILMRINIFIPGMLGFDSSLLIYQQYFTSDKYKHISYIFYYSSKPSRLSHCFYRQ